MRIFVLCVLALVVLGCTATKGTGGGWMSSTVPGEKATFGFQAHCDPRDQTATGCTVRASGFYEDKAANVKMQLVAMEAAEAPAGPAIGANCQISTVQYRSTERSRPGPGSASVTVCDDDTLPAGPKEARVPDIFSIVVTSGPYAGYTNAGPVLGGNIKIVLATP